MRQKGEILVKSWLPTTDLAIVIGQSQSREKCYTSQVNAGKQIQSAFLLSKVDLIKLSMKFMLYPPSPPH